MQQSKQNMASLTNEAAASSSSSSLPLSSTDHQNHYTYQVFLSFRGEDTRSNFTDHLHSLLCDRGIETFRDADKLRIGEDISQELLKAIEQSRVSIVVFSQNYASSRWCLDELVKILDCRKSKGQKFIPVFYKVAASDVRHQRGAFGDAFATLDQCKYKDSMDKWKAALKEAADLSGWRLKEGGSEAEFIKKIVEDLLAKVINPSCELHVAEHPIGLGSCRQEVNKLLDADENNMVGIWGPGGIGKTTIAKDVFNSICHKFESSCFLADVRSNSNGLAQLQERLLHDVLRDSNLKVSSVDQGVSFIKKRMKNKKVLLILDDVSHSSQLKNLVPSPDCFGPGSRILITTRDKRCLTDHQVNKVYEVKILDDDQALELFSLNAFKSNEPPHAYLELARRAVRYAQGLPLALIVLGSHLFCRSTEAWEAIIGSCKGGPQADIQKVLKLSYDALEKDLQELFLDIACFFKGEHVDRVKPILEACYDRKTMMIGIAEFEEKALIRIDRNEIWMHDLIEEMGKGIVYQESPDEPGQRSRVWSDEDVNDVLTNNTGTNKVIGIQAQWGCFSISLNAKSFSEMKKLRYISMRTLFGYIDYPSDFSGDIDYLSDQLRWLDWPECPLQCFPSNFHAKKLVNLDISWSHGITRLWEGHKNFSRLTCMNLRGCESLTELPDLSEIPKLKELNLRGCVSLKEFPNLSGIPNLKELDLSGCESLKELPDLSRIPNLEKLDLYGCTSLVEVPDSIRFLHNLVTLYLSGCKSLKELPDLSEIPNLKELDLSECTSLVEVPDSIRFLHNLVTLNVDGCSNLLMFPRKINLKSVETICMSDCKLQEFPEVGEEMVSLRSLNLGGTCIKDLHPSIAMLIGLEELILWNCENLTTLPYNIYVLHNLKTLVATGCSKLATFPKIPIKMDSLRQLYLNGSDIRELDESIENLIGLEDLDLINCKNLITLPYNIYKLHNLKSLYAEGCSKLAAFPEIPVKMDYLRRLSLTGNDIRELDESIKNLIALEDLALTDCKNLTTLPYNIYELHNLKSLKAIGCSKLVTFPEIPVKMDSLRWLSLSGSDIRELDESIENLFELEYLILSDCKNLTTLPCSIYGLQNLSALDLRECSKLVRFPTNTKILNVDGCSLSLPKLWRLDISGCTSLSDCDFLMTLDCWESLVWLNLSRNNFVSLPACLTKFVRLRELDLSGCKRLQGIPKLPPNVGKYKSSESLIEAASPSIEDDDDEEPIPSSRLSLSSEPPKRHHSPEEPSTVIPPKRQRAAGQPSMVHFAHDMAISPIPMTPHLHSSHQQESGMVDWLSSANDNYDREQEQQEQPAMPPIPDYSASASTSHMWWNHPPDQILQTSNWQANLDLLPNSLPTLANLDPTSPASTPEFQQ